MESLHQRRFRRLSWGLGCFVALASWTWVSARAQSPAQKDRTSGLDLTRALSETVRSGRPTVLVITTLSDPGSRASWNSVKQLPRFQQVYRSNLFVEMVAESNPSEAARLGALRFPAFRVYRRGPKGLELAGARDGMTDVASIIGWLSTVGVEAGAARMIQGDDVIRTAYQFPSPQSVLPSPQQYATPPTSSPAPSAPAPSPVPTVTVPVNQTYSAPSQTPVVISAPNTPVVFQPQAPQILIGPTPPPNVYFASAPATPPNIAMTAPSPQTNAPQLLASAPSALAGAPAAPQAQALQLLAAAPSVPSALAGAPAAPQAQSGPAAAPLTVILTNPGIIDRVLGCVGRNLAQRGNPRVEIAPAQMIAANAYLAQLVQTAAADPTILLQESDQRPPAKCFEGPTPSPQCEQGTCGHAGHCGDQAAPSRSRRWRLFHW